MGILAIVIRGLLSLKGPHLGRLCSDMVQKFRTVSCACDYSCSKTDSGWQSAALFLQQIAEEGGES